MMRMKLMAIAAAMTVCVAAAGFAQDQKSQPQPQVQSQAQAQPQVQPAETKAPFMMSPREIRDIPVPDRFNLDKSNTFLAEARGMKVGVLAYTGRMDGYALAMNIQDAMKEEKWKLQNIIIYKSTVNINFVKDDRTCNVFIDEGWFSTRVEYRVGMVAGN